MSTDDIVHFSQLPLAPAVSQAVAEIGYETPTPIQVAAIGPLLAGRDLLGQAQTGTGKTAAFALPLLSRLDTSHKHPQLLVLAPTRELALQVADEIQAYSRHLPGFQVLPLYGGQNMAQQLRALQRGVQAVVGTPGRIQDHLRRGTLKLDRLTAVVIDEADEMLKMGFVDEVEKILAQTPPQRQVALFSATMTQEIMRIARRHLKDPEEIRLKTRTTTVETITQHYWLVQGLQKLDALTRILEAEAVEAMLIFVRTKVATVELAEKLAARGFASAALNGDMTQGLREKTVEQLKDGNLDIVVATDVAARGLDVQRISHVVNYDIPYDTESYVHRIGRTGRAGRQGQAIIFVAPREMRMLHAIEKATRQQIARLQLPSRREVNQRRIDQFKEKIITASRQPGLEFFEELVAQAAAEAEIDSQQLAAGLAYLLQQQRPLLPEEEPATPEPEPQQRPQEKGGRKTGPPNRPRGQYPGRRESPPRKGKGPGKRPYPAKSSGPGRSKGKP
ncbi:MAG: DEAD/DEAH box helicase [Desulfurivibrio sp.]|nr:DEAD/DEAH box helicase [Desulfurivibrio sp.]